jgi:hypothetical protein
MVLTCALCRLMLFANLAAVRAAVHLPDPLRRFVPCGAQAWTKPLEFCPLVNLKTLPNKWFFEYAADKTSGVKSPKIVFRF